MLSVSVHDYASWRNQARSLLLQRTPPHCVQWGEFGQPSLFEVVSDKSARIDQLGAHGELKVPAEFIGLAKEAALYCDANKPSQKWALLYSVLWRTVMKNRDTLRLSSDPEVQTLQRMRKSVSRDRHKMKAFVRFQQVTNSATEKQQGEYFVSWFEPEHAIIESTAPFFMRRFTAMNWSILTPQGCAHWNTKELKLSPALSRVDVAHELLENDVLDDFWRVYYCSIFNPARLKEKAMTAEMPKKYWQYLPESRCIKSLTTNSGSVTQRMLDAPLTNPTTAREKSRGLREAQNALREEQTEG